MRLGYFTYSLSQSTKRTQNSRRILIWFFGNKTSPPEILLAAAKHLQMEEHLGDGKESKDGAPPPEYDAAMKKEKEMKEGASAAEEEFNLDITDDEADIKPPTAGLFVGLVSNNC
jgi:hypothetical protein